jgi:hypothetical protein
VLPYAVDSECCDAVLHCLVSHVGGAVLPCAVGTVNVVLHCLVSHVGRAVLPCAVGTVNVVMQCLVSHVNSIRSL